MAPGIGFAGSQFVFGDLRERRSCESLALHHADRYSVPFRRQPAPNETLLDRDVGRRLPDNVSDFKPALRFEDRGVFLKKVRNFQRSNNRSPVEYLLFDKIWTRDDVHGECKTKAKIEPQAE